MTTQDEALRAIIQEALAAKSALCEHELVIRLDTIVAVARAALDAGQPKDGNAPP